MSEGAIPSDELIALVEALELITSGSHYFAVLAGWSRPASIADLSISMLAGNPAGTPWDVPTNPESEPPATPEEYARAAAELGARSAYRGQWPTPPNGGEEEP